MAAVWEKEKLKLWKNEAKVKRSFCKHWRINLEFNTILGKIVNNADAIMLLLDILQHEDDYIVISKLISAAVYKL